MGFADSNPDAIKQREAINFEFNLILVLYLMSSLACLYLTSCTPSAFLFKSQANIYSQVRSFTSTFLNAVLNQKY